MKYVFICLASVVLFSILMTSMGCSLVRKEDKGRLVFKSTDGDVIEYACIVPVFSRNTGFAYGPEGKGRQSSAPSIMSPFVARSGDYIGDYYPPSTAFVIPPFFGAGTSYYLYGFLVLKGGYIPKSFGRGHIESQGKSAHGFILQKSPDNNENSGAIEMLSRKNLSKDEIKLLFDFWISDKEDVKNLLSESDLILIKSCI